MIKVVLIVSVAVLFFSVFLMRDFLFKPVDYVPKFDDLKPRTIFGAGLGICAMIALWHLEEIAQYIERL